MPYMYILECADGSFYTGSTWNLEKRLWQHQNGMGANHTKKRLPVKLVYCETYNRVEDAFRREKEIQGWSRRKKQALIDGNIADLIEFSKNYTEHGRPEERLASTGSATDLPGELATAALPEPAEGSMASTSSVTDLPRESATSPLPEPVEGSVGLNK